MNILHVLSQFEVTGAEVYAATLVEQQARRGHTLFVVSDTLTVPFNATCLNIPIGQRSYGRRFRNILWLIRCIRMNNIQIIHAHSRAASWVCSIASFLTDTPMLSTVHGKQHLHLSSTTMNMYGKQIIAVCESIVEHLSRELGIDRRHITVIPNGFPSSLWKRKSARADKKSLFVVPKNLSVISFIGRLSGPKGDVVRFLLRNVLVSLRAKRPFAFFIIGGSIVPQDIHGLIAEANKAAGKEFVFFLGFQKEVTPYIKASDLIFGSGRIAIEALLLGKQIIAFGESQYLGIVNEDTLQEAIRTNFGDAGTITPPEQKRVYREIETFLKRGRSATIPRTIVEDARRLYDIKSVENKIQHRYERAVIETKSPGVVPVLMYHRVVAEQPTSSALTGLTVTARQFDTQLRSLKQRGYSTITFHQYDAFARGERLLPPRPIILTFDDGYEDNYTLAFPLLKRYAMNGVIYLVADRKRRTNFWDRDKPQARLLTTAQVREMARSGMEFGSHTVAHPHLPQLTIQKAREEVRISKRVIEDMLGAPVISFAYPYGEVNREVKTIVAEEEYRFAVAADNGPLVFYQDPLQIRRTQVFPWTGTFGFWKKTQPWYQRYKAMKS